MRAKRREKKKRMLRNGESQRKEGRYVYKYTDYSGKEQFVYSWTLEATDKAPEGKRPDLSPRERGRIQKDLNTRAGYQTMLNILRQEPFGYRKIERTA